MSSLSTIRAEMMASIAVKQVILKDEHLLGQIESLAMQCLDALKAGGKVIFAGNGGSFADAQHLSAEFVSRFNIDRAPLASLALGTNNSAFSAIGNDYGFEQVFARELEAVAKREDIFVGISTSGNSANVIAAVDKALELNVAVTCLTGQSGGKLIERCTSLCVPSTETARIQECHITIGHIICGLVENMYFSKGNN
jgi:D-sedoheptulose 7-phosphate isomerase